MPQMVEAQDINEGDRLLLADCMEFTVVSTEIKRIDDAVYNRTLHCVVLEIDDRCETDWGKDDTGSMRIVKDPTEQLQVLEEGEEVPMAKFQS